MVVALLVFTCTASAQNTKKPEFTASQLLKPLSRTQIEAIAGKQALIDSGYVPSGKAALKMYVYSPVMFEGFSSRLQIVVANDTTKTVTLQLPRLRKATSDDFAKVSKKIAAEIGDPTVTVNNYINYLRGQEQPLFGVLKDGLITITLMPSDHSSMSAK